jgi:hypothetical protein
MKPRFFRALALMTMTLGCRESKDEDTPTPTPVAEGYSLSDQGAFVAKIVWNTPPVAESFDNSAEVHLLDRDSQPVTSSRLIRFSLYMTSMGHPSTNEEEMVLEQKDAGHWTVSRIYFSMSGSAGSWAVDLDAAVNDTSDHVRVRVEEAVQ